MVSRQMDDELVDMVKQDMQQAMTKVTSNPESMTITDFLKVCKETQHAMNSVGS